MEDAEDYWCATINDFDSKGKWWGYCTGHCDRNCKEPEYVFKFEMELKAFLCDLFFNYF